jgi:class 3 adenylate cyclase
MATTEIDQLKTGMAALEAQRAILGDAIVDSALGPMREKLAALEAQSRADQQRKQATVLFADVSGFTAMSETMDAEEVAGVMNDLWAAVDRAITEQGGHIDKHIGDAVMALWGADTAREDDPERAVRAALAMQAAIGFFCETRGAALAMRIGINTGPVVLGAVGTTGEFTAMGDAVNLASRLEHAAPVGGVLIGHDTYRLVRGIFDVEPQAPLV